MQLSQSPSSSYLFSHFDFSSCGNEGVLLLYMSQSPSSSYLFSHLGLFLFCSVSQAGDVAIALKLLPVFTQNAIRSLSSAGFRKQMLKSQSPSSSYLFSHLKEFYEDTQIHPQTMSQSPSSSYLFSHSCCF